MPLQKVIQNGRTCWRWGNKGHVYCQKDGKKRALKQGLAENGGKFVEGEDAQHSTAEERHEALDEFNSFNEAVHAYMSKEQRDKVPDADFGDPENKKFPITDQKHLDSAVKLVGREPAAKQAAIKARIKKIAKRKGLKMPQSWQEEG